MINSIGNNLPTLQTTSKLDTLETLWSDWYNHPNQKTAEALLKFLDQNKQYFEQAAKNKPVPPGFPKGSTFDHIFDQATTYLNNWISHSCPSNGVAAPSEWIGDIVEWLN